MIKKLFFVVSFFVLVNPSKSQITVEYNQTYLRDIIVIDSSIFTIHFYPSPDTLDYTNSKGYLEIYRFDENLNMIDSIILDSLQIGKCIEKDGDIFIVATRFYADTFTCSINLFHLNQNLDILKYREIKQTNISFSASDFIFINDSIRMSVVEDRTMATGMRYVKEFLIDTAFVDLDSTSCGIQAGPMVFYYKNAISINNKQIYSGNLDYYNFNPPIYHIFSNDGTCNQITPFSLWFNYIYNENSFELMRGHSNFLLKDNHSFYISMAGEENFGNFDSFTGVLKTDTLFNPIDYYIHQPTNFEENVVPFKNKSILHVDDKILLASNTKMEAWLNMPPYVENEIRIDVIDTSFNFISGINLDPIYLNRPYYGVIIEMMQDGSILLGGNLVSLTSSDPPLAFLIKYSSLSELLNVVEQDFKWSSLDVYPNPAKDIIKIGGNELFENSTVNFYDITGKLLLSIPYSENGISIEAFSNGIYFIKIQTKESLFTGKFIKD